MLVSRTSPSGTMVTSPATVPRTASATPSVTRNWLMSRAMPTGTMRIAITVMIRLMLARSSERARVNFFACSASWAA